MRNFRQWSGLFFGAIVLLSGEPSPKSLFVFWRISAGSSIFWRGNLGKGFRRFRFPCNDSRGRFRSKKVLVEALDSFSDCGEMGEESRSSRSFLGEWMEDVLC